MNFILKFGIDDETISVQSKVNNWISERDDFNGKQVLNKVKLKLNIYTTRTVIIIILKSLVTLLKESQSGRLILQYEQTNKNLTTDHRNSLIKIIVEEAITNQIPIRIQDFPLLLNEIVWLFPSEKSVQVTNTVFDNRTLHFFLKCSRNSNNVFF